MGAGISKTNRSFITGAKTTSFFYSQMINSILQHVTHISLNDLCRAGTGVQAASGADGGCSPSRARSTTSSNSISRLTSCSARNLHENQIHKFSHGFDQEFCGCYCSFFGLL